MKSRLAITFLLLLAAGCILETNEPLTDPLNAKADPNMYGHWVASPETNDEAGEELHLFIGKHHEKGNPNSIMDCVMVNWKTKTREVGDGSRKMYFTASKIGQESYLNLLIAKGEEDSPDLSQENSYAQWVANKNHRCNILRYSCDGEILRLWNYNNDVLKQLCKQKQLTPIETDGKDEHVTTESLLKYLEKNGGEKLFSEAMFEAKKAP
jgi:hypothetical protein